MAGLPGGNSLLLSDQKFTLPLDQWREVETAGHQTVKELLAVSADPGTVLP